MMPAMDVRLIPVYVSGSIHPLPSARRCFALGQAIRRAVEHSALARRVVVAASGAFSFEVGGPRMSETSHVGVPGAGVGASGRRSSSAVGEFERLVAETTPEQLAAAGNASGEILDWLVMLGTIDPRPPVFIEAQLDEGHALRGWIAREHLRRQQGLSPRCPRARVRRAAPRRTRRGAARGRAAAHGRGARAAARRRCRPRSAGWARTSSSSTSSPASSCSG